MMKSAIFAATLAIAPAAIASPPQVNAAPRSEQVSYTDQDLDSPSGQSALRSKIRSAADRVCDLGGTPNLEDFGKSADCYRAAMKSGLKQMNQLIASRRSGATFAAATLIITAR